jgi:tRNA pseudouridine38-40 synthase
LRYFIHFAYNGSSYHGWQIQPDEITVQESLEKALSTILRDTMSVVGAGRTDSGVHARMMIAHFDMLTELADVNDLKHRLNAFLDEDIVIYDIKPVKSDAHARFTAVSRSYEYHIFLGRTPFYNDLCWEIYNRNLDIDAMNKAA